MSTSPVEPRGLYAMIDALLEALDTFQFTHYLSFQARPREAGRSRKENVL